MSTTIHSADPDTLTNAKRPGKPNAAKKKAAEVSEKTRKIATESAQTASDMTHSVSQDVSKGLSRANDKAREITTQQPLLALAGALAVGVAIGMAVKSRR